jgi:hypothetical protein
MTSATSPEREEAVEFEKVTTEWMEAQVETITYRDFGTLTVAIVTLKSGFRLVGASACLNPEDYDADVGKRIAKVDALNQLWKLEGYRRMQNARGA